MTGKKSNQSSKKRPRVLITGGAGFLGSHLCDRYIEEGYEVICMDNLITGNADNIAHLIGNDRFEFIKHDVTNYIHVGGDLDLILHFASPASPIDYLEMPIQTLKVGSLGTHKALGLAKAKDARFLLASTSEVYGDPKVHPQKEDYWGNVNPIGDRGVYDEAKRFAEALAMAYHRYHGVETRIVRIFNTYGSRMRLHDGRALPTFMRQAINDEITNGLKGKCFFVPVTHILLVFLFTTGFLVFPIRGELLIQLKDLQISLPIPKTFSQLM